MKNYLNLTLYWIAVLIKVMCFVYSFTLLILLFRKKATKKKKNSTINKSERTSIYE